MSQGDSQRGINRERQLVNALRETDWFAFRAPGSLGVADVIALKDGHTPMLIEVKSTHRGPYHGFLPADRADLAQTARWAGADAWLVWWPARAKPVWLAENEWPKARVA